MTGSSGTEKANEFGGVGLSASCVRLAFRPPRPRLWWMGVNILNSPGLDNHRIRPWTLAEVRSRAEVVYVVKPVATYHPSQGVMEFSGG